MRTLMIAIVMILVAALTLPAADLTIGTWKLNTAKSKYSPGPAPKSVTVTYSNDGDWIVVKSEGIDAEGKPTSNMNRYKRDGKEYPYKTSVVSGKITVKQVDDHHFESVIKGEGSAMTTARTEISKDGKTRTQTVTGVNAQGQKVRNVIVYEKQ